MKRQIFLDCAVLCLLAAALIWPLFQVQYADDWMSIEGSFIADARYIREHFPHPKWHALWYCGTRFDYIYPPLTRFGAAIVSMLFQVVPAQGYHIYIATTYCLGVAAVYFLVRAWTRRRWTSFLAAAAFALVSPVFAMFPAYRNDSAHWAPLRLNVLVRWGEGPHMSALAILPFALGFLYYALKRRSLVALAACAAASALVVSNNLYGALALAIFFPTAVWAIWLGESGRFIWLRAAAIAALTYGLCAWWLTPSFVSVTARNLMLVAQPGNVWSKAVATGAIVLFLAASWRFARSRPDPEWCVFLGGSLFFFGIEVFGNKWFNFRMGGEPMRFLPELDLVLILVFVEVIRRLRRTYAIVASAIFFTFSIPYLLNAWKVYPADPAFERRVEYRLTEWVAWNLPGARTFSTGSVSLWYTTWRDIAEVTGGSDQGMQSLMPALMRWHLTMGSNVERDIAWLIATGSDALIAHEANSQEIYHHMKEPRKYMNRLAVIYDRDGDIVYRVPRRFPGLARVVSESRMATLQPIPWSDEDREQIRAYADAAEASATQVDYQRVSITEMRLRARTQPGESILVQESWDSGWRAYESGERLEIRKDILDLMRIETPPGDHDIRLVYDWPVESRAGQILTLLALVLVASLFGYSRIAGGIK
jgi:hypothetical protein